MLITIYCQAVCALPNDFAARCTYSGTPTGILLHPLGTPVERRHPPPLDSVYFFLFFSIFNVNVCWLRACLHLPNTCPYPPPPPPFQIPRNNTGSQSRVSSESRCLNNNYEKFQKKLSLIMNTFFK